MKQNEAVVILGMHRSGTSAMAGVSTALGASPPSDLLPAKPDNPKGFWESDAVMRLNDDVLRIIGSDWSDWRSINAGVFSSAPVQSLTDKAAELLETRFTGDPLIVLKDPRVSRLLPFWRRALRQQAYLPRSIVMVRSPVEVALSLQVRNGFSLDHGMLLWLRYSLDAEVQSRGFHRCVVMWSDLHANWRREVARVSSETGLNWPNLSDASAASVDTYLSRELYHHRSLDSDLPSDPRVHALVSRAYKALSELAQQPQANAALAELDEVRRAFDEADKLFGLILVQKDLKLAEAGARSEAAAQELAAQASLLSMAEGARGEAEAHLRASQETAVQEMAAQASLLSIAESALGEAEARLRASQDAAALELAAQASLLATAEGARSEAEARLRELQLADAQVMGELDQAREELGRRVNELHAATSVIEGLTADLGAVEDRQRDVVAELDEVRLQRATLEDELARIVLERDGGASRIIHLERQATSAENESSALRAQNEALNQDVIEATKLRDHHAARSRNLEQDLGVATATAGDRATAVQALEVRLAAVTAEADKAVEQQAAAVRELADQTRRADEAEGLLAETRSAASSEQQDRVAERDHVGFQLRTVEAALAQLEEERREAVLQSQVDELRAAAALRRLATVEAGWLFKLQRWLEARAG